MSEKGVTLTDLLDGAATRFADNRAVVVSGGPQLTHSQLQKAVEKCALQLLRSGVKPGDVVALIFPNSIEFVVAFLATIRARATAAPLNQAYTEEEFRFYLEDSRSVMLIVPSRDGGNKAAVSAARALDLPIAEAQWQSEGEVELLAKFKMELLAPKGGGLLEVKNEEGDEALFLHTSGTTSRPKGVPLTQANLSASVLNIAAAYELSEWDATVIVMPLFHVHGLMAAFLSTLVTGGAAILPGGGRFSASTFWSDMKLYGASWYTSVPTIHQILLERHCAKPESEYPSLCFIRSCSSPLAPSTLEQLESAFSAPVLEAYAMTEASHQMTSNPLPLKGPHKSGSVGLPTGIHLGILDEEGNVLPSRIVGEVCIKGPNVTKGYKNNLDANQTAFLFGWFHTGDRGFVDEDGYLHLTGRIKELINRGGEKISPLEVDVVLLAHPAVAQAVSFAAPDNKYGEEVNAALVLREGFTASEEEIKEYCKQNLASFKIPKKIFFTEDVPRTATGKIQRRIVADHFLASWDKYTTVYLKLIKISVNPSNC